MKAYVAIAACLIVLGCDRPSAQQAVKIEPRQVVETSVTVAKEEPAKEKCTMPKFKQGDVLRTVVGGYPVQVYEILPYTDRGVCVYNAYYEGETGLFIYDNEYWEFQLVRP